jgi:hypothetical protein
MRTMEMAETGRETANHCSQSMGFFMADRAMRFCGELIGEAWPPMFAASAIPSCSTVNR